MSFLSIIVPIYNVEMYIEKCVNSILTQNSQDIEYIFVDDCSPDSSLQLLDKMIDEQKYDNIKIIHNTENKGLSVARNIGQEAASGEYIWFVDSDDWIAEGIIAELVSVLKKEKPDILALVALMVDECNNITSYTPYIDKYDGIFRGKDFISSVSPCAPFYIFNHAFWKDKHLSFYPGIFHEDLELTPRARYFANRVMCFHKPVYYYRKSVSSITSHSNLKRAKDLITVANSLNDFSNNHVDSEDHPIFSSLIGGCIFNACYHATRLSRDEEGLFFNILMNNRHLFRSCYRAHRLKYKLLSMFSVLPVSFLEIIFRFRHFLQEHK